MSKQDKLDIAKSIVKKSGNSFHAKVLNALKDSGWDVLVSPYYSDQSTGKPREIDLIAEKSFDFISMWDKPKGTLRIQLYVECKFFKQTTVFWTHYQDIESTLNLLEATTALRRTNSFMRDHHYLKQENNRVVKLFAGENQTATEGEQVYKALNQSLNAMIAYSPRGSILPPIEQYDCLGIVRYPIIVCGGEENLFQVDIESNKEPQSVENNAILEVNYAYKDLNDNHRSEYFLIDIVRFDKLNEFLTEINKDFEAMKVMYGN